MFDIIIIVTRILKSPINNLRGLIIHWIIYTVEIDESKKLMTTKCANRFSVNS